MRILLIEKHAACARATENILKHEECDIITVSQHKALTIGHSATSDVVLLCDKNEQHAQKSLRTIRKNIAQSILVVTMAAPKPGNVERVIDCGADDCIDLERSSAEELLARCHALMRRGRVSLFRGTTLSNQRIAIDLRTGTVVSGQSRIRLTKTEYRICAQLLLSKRGFVSKEKLRTCLRQMDRKESGHLVDVHVANLRRKLSGIAVIETVPCRGLRLQKA